jgi:hypothetical protein
MCRVCEGFSIEDVTALDAVRIEENGWVVQAVVGSRGPDDGTESWAYTVGLLDVADHPELIMTGVAPSIASSVLSMLSESVVRGERYLVDETIDLGGAVAVVGAVHEVQYARDTFSTWYRLRSAGVLHSRLLEAVQIRLPIVSPTFGVLLSQPVLADRDARVWAESGELN